MMRISRHTCSFLVGLALLGASLALVPQAGVTQEALSTTSIETPYPEAFVRAIEGVSEYRLQNGLRILLAPDHSKPDVTVNMTYLVGSRHENYGQTGMAHLLEHMLFRGTPDQPDALAEFSRRGIAANGTTNADRTNYFASFAADDETLDWYIHWQADSMLNATITQEDLDAEMTVVRNEMERGENSPFRVLMQKMQAAAYQWHNYGKTTIGARSDVENVDVGQLRAFYEQYYQPDNAVLIVSGYFDVAAVLDTIHDAFADIPKPERTLPSEYTQEPVQDGERQVSLARHGGSPLVAALYHIPAASSPDYIAVDLGVDMLGDTPSGPLYKNLVRQNLSTDVFGFAASTKDPGYALFGAQLEPGMDPQAALKALTKTLDTLADHPFDAADLERQRNQWLTQWSRIYADPAQLASLLSDAVAVGDWRLFFWHRDQVENASLETVQQALEDWLVPSNRTTGLYLPTEKPKRAPGTTPTDIDALLKDYTGKGDQFATAIFDPTPENIQAQTQRSKLSLDNGDIQLALLSKPTRGDRVEARLAMRYADVDQLRSHRSHANAAAALLTRGTDNLSRQQIRDRINALKGTLSFDDSNGQVTASLSTTEEHLPELVALTLEIMRHASFPEDEVEQYQRSRRTALHNAMADPQSLAVQTLARHGSPWDADDIRYTPTFEESLDALQQLTADDLQAFHKQFYGAVDLLFSAVGAFDKAAVTEAIKEGVAGWSQAPAYTRISKPYYEVAPETFDLDTPDKANAFYLSGMRLELQDTDEDFAALYLADYLLGRSETSRLWNRVRTQEGLSYNIRSQLDASSFEKSGRWLIYAIFAPENESALKTAIQETLDSVLEEGFTEEEVQQGIHALLNYRKLARARDSVLASTWLNYLDNGRDFTWSADIDNALQRLTAEQVNQALRKTLQPDKLSTAIAADQEKTN